MPRNPTRSEEAALLRECLLRWYYADRFVARQEYRVNYAGLAMERSRQLSALERTHRIVDWAGLFGAGERQRPLGRERSRYVVGPSRRHVASLSDLQWWMAETGDEEQPGE